MNESLVIKPASRVGIIPWIDLYSESGCGKTMSGLLLARGIAGPTGKIVLADSESKRGSLYADVIPGGYDVIDFDAPFTPAKYREVAEALFKSGAAVGMIDSMSHEWEGIGGVLDMAAENERTSGRPGLHNWKTPKFEHAQLVQLLLRSPIPLICCIRAKYKTRQIKGTKEMADDGSIRKDQVGKTIILKDSVTSPIQAEDFIFEATAHAEILPDHSINLTKCSHPDLRKCFPEKGPITVEHGAAIARWCAAPRGPGMTSESGSSTQKSGSKPDSDIKKLKKELWELTKDKHQDNPQILDQWLLNEGITSDTEVLKDIGPARLSQIIAAVKSKLQNLL